MGIDCYGWVEVNDPTDANRPARNPDWWSGTIRIDDVAQRSYRVFGYFFGVRYPFDTPVAPFRGFPPNMSEEVRQAVQSQFDTSDDLGASWILWSEIVASNWRVELEVPQSWALLFDLMGRLA